MHDACPIRCEADSRGDQYDGQSVRRATSTQGLRCQRLPVMIPDGVVAAPARGEESQEAHPTSTAAVRHKTKEGHTTVGPVACTSPVTAWVP